MNVEKSRDHRTDSLLHKTAVAKRKCFFCRSDKHGTRTCDSKKSLGLKKQQLLKDNCCFTCTSRGHEARFCQVKLTCSLCHGRHASSMCGPTYKKPESSGKSDSTTAFVPSNTIMRSNQSSCLMSNMENGAFLQTFRDSVGHDAKRTYIGGILDGISQRSFIKKYIARKLRLKVVSQITIALSTFGTETP